MAKLPEGPVEVVGVSAAGSAAGRTLTFASATAVWFSSTTRPGSSRRGSAAWHARAAAAKRRLRHIRGVLRRGISAQLIRQSRDKGKEKGPFGGGLGPCR